MNQDNEIKKALDLKIIEFMLLEYQTLREVRAADINLGETRTNIFLAFVSGAVAFLAIMGQLLKDIKILSIVSFLILVILLLFGIFTYIRLVERIVIVTFYTRGMNRIRRYFANLEPNIKEYLILPIYDDTPKFYRKDARKRIGLRGIISLLNSIIAGFCTFNLLTILFGQSLELWLKIMLGFVVLTICFVIFEKYSNSRLRKKERTEEVHFPSQTKESLGSKQIAD